MSAEHTPWQPGRAEFLSWGDVDQLVDILLPQLEAVGGFEAMLMVTRGGIILGGMLAEAIDIQHLLTAAVDFPQTEAAGLLAWPHFLQFPDSELLTGRRTLIVDDVWGSGRTSTAVRARVEGAGAEAFTCVFHFNPFRSLYSQAQPDFYGARTDAYIVYPWESDRDLRRIGLYDPQSS